MKQIQFIKETPNCYAIIIGDLLENATKASVGAGVYEQNMTPQEQLDFATEALSIIKDRILAAILGNHEIRSWYTSGLNIIETMCNQLDIPYMGYQGYLNLVVQNRSYSVMIHHGKGGGSTPGGKLNSLKKLGKVANVDLYICGHMHVKLYHKEMFYEVSPGGGDMQVKKQHYVCAGSGLDYFDGYAEMSALAPSGTGFVKIDIDSDSIKVYI